MLDQDKRMLINIITKRLPGVKIYLFGSRARGDFRPTSDIDVALDMGKKIDEAVVRAIKEAVEESSIPFTVDIVDMYAVSEDFKKHIMKDRKLWL